MRYFIAILLLVHFSIFSQAQQWNWIQKIEGERCESGMGISYCPDGNFVVTGIYEDEGGATFESIDGDTSYFKTNADTFPQSHSTLFLAKYKLDGKLLWKTNAYAANGITPWDIHVDSKGNSIVSGNFRGMAIFHSTTIKSKAVHGTPPPYSNEGAPLNYYVAKYDPDGNLMWVKVARSSDHSVAFEAKTDANDNIYVRAYCHYGSIAFDDYSLFPRTDSSRHTGNYSLIVVKYNPEGQEQWITRGGNFTIRQMDVTPEGEVTLYGSYQSQAILYTTSGKKFLPANPVETGFNNMVLTLDKSGDVKSIENGFEKAPMLDLHKLVRDKVGNYYLQLLCYESANMGKVGELSIAGRKFQTKSYDTFIAKFTPQRQLIWINQISGQYAEQPLDIILDENENIVLTGHFNRVVVLKDVSGDSLELRSDFQTMYLASYTSNGALRFAETCGSLFKGFGEQCNLAIAPGNKLLITGQINVPSMIGTRNLDVKGKKGWNSPSWDKQIDYGHYSDAFIGSVSLDNFSNSGTTAINLQLNLEEAARIIEAAMAKLSKAMDEAHLYIQFEEQQVYTPVKSEPLSYGTPSNLEPIIYPNPAGEGNPQVTVRLELPVSGLLKWSLQTQNGALVQSETITAVAGINTWQFSVNSLARGVYNLSIEFNKSRVLKRIVVQ